MVEAMGGYKVIGGFKKISQKENGSVCRGRYEARRTGKAASRSGLAASGVHYPKLAKGVKFDSPT
jgi:hypothetical protein